MRIRYLWLGLFAGVIILCTAYWLLTRSWSVAPLTIEEKQMTDKLFEQTKTQCIGRYLFEVPVSFNNVLTDRARINDMKITSQRLYRPAFEQRIRLREQELKNSYTVDPIDSPFLKQVYQINENTVIFDRNKNESVGGFGRILEGHLYHNDVAFIVTSEIRDVSDPKYQKEREYYLNSGTKESDLNDKPQKLAEMQNLLSRLNGRKDDDVPTQAGICIPEGFIRDGNIRTKEKIALLYQPGDFFLAIRSDNFSRESESLLERENEINAVIIKSGAHTLKKDSVALSGITAEEWLMKARQGIYQPEDKMVSYYLFSFYINEKSADFEHPILSVKLHNSGLETKNYTDSQLVDIWDRITRTFRYRPNAF